MFPDRLHLVVLLMALAGTGAGCGSGSDPVDPAARSAIVITIDTLRADHLSGYGYEAPTSPNLDGFLARGAQFERAFSTSCRTAPSHVSLFTGTYPSFNTVDVDNGSHPLHDGHETLAELCLKEGIETAAVVGNPVLSRKLKLDQGFTIYDDDLPDREINRDVAERIATNTVRRARQLLAELADQRFFLWIHFQDPHGPYTAPEEYLGERTGEAQKLELGENHSGYEALPAYQALGDERDLAEYRRRYDAEIRFLDEQIGTLLADLSGDRLAETLVVLTADHGEAIGEDGFYFAHGHGLGLDQTRVPLGFVGAGVRAGTRFEASVSNIDVFATVLDALGLTQPDGDASESLLPSLRTGDEPEGRTGYAESVTQRAVFRDGVYVRMDRRPLEDRKFWETGNPWTGAPYIPLGRTDARSLGGDDTVAPATVTELEQALAAFSTRAEKARAEIRPLRGAARELSDEEVRRLRSLGYMK